MKWMMVGLAASGALVYALVFLAQTQQGPNSARAEASMSDLTEGLVEEIDRPESETSSATMDAVAVSNPVTPQPQPPAWMQDPWPAGVRFYQDGNYADAVEALEAAVEEQETSGYRHYLLGLAYLKNDEPEGAVDELQRSLELSSNNVRGLVNLARAHLVLEEYEEARTAIDTALELNIDDGDAWNVLGRVELGVSNLPAAEAAFAKAVDKDTTHAYAWNNLAYSRILQDKFDEALTPALAATESDLEVSYFYNNLGIVLEQLEDLTGARRAFAMASDLGHDRASQSHDRVDAVLIARGEPADDTEDSTTEVVTTIEE